MLVLADGFVVTRILRKNCRGSTGQGVSAVLQCLPDMKSRLCPNPRSGRLSRSTIMFILGTNRLFGRDTSNTFPAVSTAGAALPQRDRCRHLSHSSLSSRPKCQLRPDRTMVRCRNLLFDTRLQELQVSGPNPIQFLSHHPDSPKADPIVGPDLIACSLH
jgi:hypothetical protein